MIQYGNVSTGGGVMRENIILKCTDCGEENYITTKNKKLHPDRMEVKKYCPRCNKVTVHKEKK
jgi:large subunit ribosomal protein L33